MQILKNFDSKKYTFMLNGVKIYYVGYCTPSTGTRDLTNMKNEDSVVTEEKSSSADEALSDDEIKKKTEAKIEIKTEGQTKPKSLSKRKKRELKIRSPEEQVEEAAHKSSKASVRRKALQSSLDKLLPKFMRASSTLTLSSQEYHTRLKELEATCGINSILSTEISVSIIKDMGKKNLKSSGLTKKQQMQIVLLALIEQIKTQNALIVGINNQ